MWVLYARAPAPNLPYWHGRRWLALLDAAMWPALLAFHVVNIPLNAGVVGPVALAMCAFIGAYSTPSRTPFRSDGGLHSTVMADTVPR
jgi:hypothetical protein